MSAPLVDNLSVAPHAQLVKRFTEQASTTTPSLIRSAYTFPLVNIVKSTSNVTNFSTPVGVCTVKNAYGLPF